MKTAKKKIIKTAKKGGKEDFPKVNLIHTDGKISKKVHTFEQEKRVFNMNRDKERYALVNFDNGPSRTDFVLINMKDDKKLTITVKDHLNTSCSCMDWKMRGCKNKLNCKHILYVVSQILHLDFSITAKNLVRDWSEFEAAFDRIKINYKPSAPNKQFVVPEDKVLTEEDLCPICYTDFMSDPKENLINCLKCRGVVHFDCFNVWMKNALMKSCVFCRDPGMGTGLKF